MSIIKSKAYCIIYSRLICRKDFKKQAHSIVFESLQTKKKILKKELSISLFSIQFLTWSHKSGEGGGNVMLIQFYIFTMKSLEFLRHFRSDVYVTETLSRFSEKQDDFITRFTGDSLIRDNHASVTIQLL